MSDAPGQQTPTQTPECSHQYVFWKHVPCNEDGWHCGTCLKGLGFRPDLDRTFIWTKVQDILTELHIAEFTYVSNSTQGMMVISSVVARCVAEDAFDQESIICFILQDREMDSRAFWRKEARAWLKTHQHAEHAAMGPPTEKGKEEEEGM